MKIAVIGAGAIGGLVAGYLKLKGQDVTLVGNLDAYEAIKKSGLEIEGVRGNFKLELSIEQELKYKPDLAVLAVKTQDLEKAITVNLGYLKGTTVLTTQNGIQADNIASKFLPKDNIISSIVMFGATYLEQGKVLHNFEGAWIIGKIFSSHDEKLINITNVLNNIFPVIVTEEIIGMKYLKVFVNANNCIPAILGMTMQEAFSDLDTSRISISIWREGLAIISAAGINLVSLPDFPVERLTKLTALPSLEAAKIFSGIMLNLSKEPLYGSILQSIKRGRTSEIDYLNGEFVRLAREHKTSAPLNQKLVGMVHQVEKSGKFFSREELLKNTEGLYN